VPASIQQEQQNTMPSYYPEMNEPKPVDDKIIIESCFVWKSYYSLKWMPENDKAVRAELKRLGVRIHKSRDPKSKQDDTGIEYVPAVNTTTGRAHYHCLVKSKSFDKIRAAGISAHSVLLD
jgi:hypothetical protein